MSEEVTQSEVTQSEVTQATNEELKQQAEIEAQAKKARVIQIVQHENGTISVVPIQNLLYRSDIVGILNQALQALQNEDIARSNAALLREAISILQNQPTLEKKDTQ